MNAKLLALLLVTIVAGSLDALADPACKTTQLKNAAPTLAEMYALADGHAKAWKADAVPVRISNAAWRGVAQRGIWRRDRDGRRTEQSPRDVEHQL